MADETKVDFLSLFKNFPNKNFELRAIAKAAYEFGKTIAQEASSGQSLHLDEHAIKRQREYIDIITGMADAIGKRPIPDIPYVHPARLDIDLSDQYRFFTKDGIPLNEDAEYLAYLWMIIAVELAGSQSAAIAGSLIASDYRRIKNHITVLTQYLNEVEKRPVVDLPETSWPGAELTPPKQG